MRKKMYLFFDLPPKKPKSVFHPHIGNRCKQHARNHIKGCGSHENSATGGKHSHTLMSRKKRDEESGYDYFGARYYIPPFLHWSSVESASSGTTDVKPYSGEFFCSAAAPVDIQWPGFALAADSGSLNKDLTIHATVIKREEGHAMPSEMENVCKLSDGVRLLPNGVHFSDTAPALLSLAYDPERIPRGYKPSDIYTYYCDDSHNWYRLERVGVFCRFYAV